MRATPRSKSDDAHAVHAQQLRPLPGTRVEREATLPRWPYADHTVVTRESVELQPVPSSERLHRVVNVTIALTAIVGLSPLLLLVALAVRLSSRGPVIYTQTRIGIDRRRQRAASAYDRRMYDLGGRPFRIYKFRTMRMNAERGSGAVWAAKNDPRITMVGRVLRKCRLDELPQLFNVIAGDMNIVGPRPERPTIVARLSSSIEEYRFRHLTKPGITGWAQVNQAYDTCLDDVRTKVRYDLEYLSRRSLMLDLLIMVKTLPVVLLRRGSL